MMQPEMTGHWTGIASLVVFVLAYAAVVGEQRLGLHKSVPVLVAAGIIWLLTGIAYAQDGKASQASDAALHNILEYAQLFLFLLVALTFVNTVSERGVFSALRAWLVNRGLSMRALFWVTGVLAFLMSPVADNLTTALVLGSVAVAVGQGRPRPEHVTGRMATRHADRWSRRLTPVRGERSRGGADGAGPGQLHVRCASSVELGHRLGVCGEYRDASPHQPKSL